MVLLASVCVSCYCCVIFTFNFFYYHCGCITAECGQFLNSNSRSISVLLFSALLCFTSFYYFFEFDYYWGHTSQHAECLARYVCMCLCMYVYVCVCVCVDVCTRHVQKETSTVQRARCGYLTHLTSGCDNKLPFVPFRYEH